jgi:SAM-dependent methyltransferase
MIIKKKIFYTHNKNRMKGEGDLFSAREYFLRKKNKNLYYLLKNRFNWINDFINQNDYCIELGSGAALLKYFLNNKNVLTSDLANHDFLDYKNIDATDTKFPKNTFDKVISSNMIHHLAYPSKHFREVFRILKPGGLYIIQDINCSIITQLITMLMRHEGFDFTVDPANENIPCNNSEDPWSGNVALPNLIFDNFENFNKKTNTNFKLVHEHFSEFLIFLNSGGVIAKTKFIPLNKFFNNIVMKLDKAFVRFPNIFSMQRSVVLKKIS